VEIVPRLRPFSWVILIVNLLFLIWTVSVISAVSEASTDCGVLTVEECEAAGEVGTAIGAGIVLFLWVVVDGILAVIWLVTKPKRRPCPVCGADVKPGITTCPKCGHDFRAAQSFVPPPPPVGPPPASGEGH
jgi:hypothetical protein